MNNVILSKYIDKKGKLYRLIRDGEGRLVIQRKEEDCDYWNYQFSKRRLDTLEYLDHKIKSGIWTHLNEVSKVLYGV